MEPCTVFTRFQLPPGLPEKLPPGLPEKQSQQDVDISPESSDPKVLGHVITDAGEFNDLSHFKWRPGKPAA